VRILPADGPAGRDDIATVIDRDRLERAFRRLSPEQSAIFVLHHYVGLSLPEVAAELGVPLGTVKSRLHYATEALRAALDADARTATSTERLA
jgi:RNA polymerase sigma-70 factor (ECF subfamily)